MSEVLTKVLAGILRVWLIPVSDWLIGHDILTSDETLKFFAEIVAAVGTTVWAGLAWWREHHAKR